MQEQTLQLLYEFTCRIACSPPFDAGTGPYGGRQYYEITGGTVVGTRLADKLVGSGGDWMLAGPDGYMRMDVRVQIETNDGAVIFAHYFGPAEANDRLKQAVTTCVSTEFDDHSIRSHWVLETGDPRYRWVNRSVFAGQGRLLPAGPDVLGFEHKVYRLS